MPDAPETPIPTDDTPTETATDSPVSADGLSPDGGSDGVSPVPLAAAGSPAPVRRRLTFEEQMLPHIDALYRTALSMTKNAGDAEDLVQDTYVRAYQFFAQFQGGTNARAWLFRIMTNLYINSYRRRTREP